MTRGANAQVDELANLKKGSLYTGKLSQCGCMVCFLIQRGAREVRAEPSGQGVVGSRDQLVRAKRALGNQVRGVLRPFGIRLPSRQGTKKFSTAAHQAVRHDHVQCERDGAVLEALAAIEGSDARLDQQLKELARRSQVCWRL
jgi:transposase